MSQIARVTDIWIGKHIKKPKKNKTAFGMVITGSFNVSGNSLPVARTFDLVMCDVGKISIIMTGSPNVSVNNRKLAQIGSIVIGHDMGMIVKGSMNIGQN